MIIVKSFTVSKRIGIIISMDIPTKYFRWQFVEKPKEIIKAIKNLLSFGLYFFSLKQLFLSLFSPWKGITWSYGRGFDAQVYFENIVGNITSRIIGFLMRITLIVACLIFEVIVFILGTLVLIIWMLMPLIIIGLFLLSFKYV
jgi:hypothetical protein